MAVWTLVPKCTASGHSGFGLPWQGSRSLNRREVTASFGLWLVVHDGESVAGMEKRSEGRHRWGEGVGSAMVL
jgi:hypothetical protein